MADFFDLNRDRGHGGWGGDAMYHLKEVMKSAGWTVHSSCNSTAMSVGSDLIVSKAVFLLNGSWLVLTHPDGTRQVMFGHRSSSSYKWYVAYSRGGTFTGGGTGAYPTGTDVGDLCGSSVTAQQLFGAGDSWIQIWAGSNGSFSCLVVDKTTGAGTTLIFLDMLSWAQENDSDPVVVGAIYGAPFSNSRFYGEGSPTPRYCAHAWLDLTGTPTFQVCCGLHVRTNSYLLFPASNTRYAGTGMDSGEEPVMAVLWGSPNTYTPSNFKGVGSAFMMVGENLAVKSTISNESAMDLAVYGSYRTGIRWDGSTVPAA